MPKAMLATPARIRIRRGVSIKSGHLLAAIRARDGDVPSKPSSPVP